MFKCKVCIEKELRISELKEQIAYFKNLLSPPARVTSYEMEADRLMSGGGQEEITMTTEAQEDEAAKIALEQDQILAGNY